MATQVPRYTAAEIRRFPDDGLRYEVIRGELFVTPAPGTPHQLAVAELVGILREYLNHNGLGRVLPAPFEVLFDQESAVQPDVLVVLEEQRPNLSTQRLTGAPALAIEIVSYSSKRTDRLEKRRLYQDEGVPEYWVVDLDQKRVERWRPRDDNPEVFSTDINWQAAPGIPALQLDLVRLFAATSI